ncbi:MAG: hypothetical protein IJJ31_01210 [Mogibacterium sp.]|nr:hypothetical protein [Mogibacterium sp.]
MKKFISIMIITVMIFSTLALTACSGGSEDLSDSKYVGTWKCTALELKDESQALDHDYILVLNGDGTGQLSGDDGMNDITWELTKDGFRTKGDAKMKFKDDGDKIKTTILGASLVFEKQ